jgi:hypothetical protein
MTSSTMIRIMHPRAQSWQALNFQRRIQMTYLLTLAAALAAQAAPMDHSQMDPAATNQAPMVMPSAPTALEPREPGQAAYAALGETVRILIADPNTDWSKVDVDALRRHLVDMDNVTMRANVATTRLAKGAQFTVTGTPEIAASIQRMTSSHFAEPDVGTGWKMTTQARPDGALVTVTSDNPIQAQKIAGLGFYGILTMGAHHQPHHVMMARGGMKH